MQIRSYQPGDELAQARIYNVAAGSLPGFKPAKPEEIARRIACRRFRSPDDVLRHRKRRGRRIRRVRLERSCQFPMVLCRARSCCKSRCSIRSSPR